MWGLLPAACCLLAAGTGVRGLWGHGHAQQHLHGLENQRRGLQEQFSELPPFLLGKD